jgi:AraC-like DNA-binding protein
MRTTTSPFRSNFYMWNGVSAIFFSNYVTDVHSHNTLQIVTDLHDRFRCRVAGGQWLTCKNIIIKENVPHQLDTHGSVQLIIYLDAATSAARMIKTRYLQDADAAQPDLDLFAIIQPNHLQQVLLKPNPLALHEIISRILRALAAGLEARKADPRINSKTDPRIKLVEQTIAAGRPDELGIPALAAQAHLSESRLRSLFRDQTGVSLYKYILYSRIRFAIRRIMAGSAVNDAAWEAGFTDNSHFHKMLVSMFGISPSQFLRDNKTMEIFTCDPSPLIFETKVYDENGRVEKVYK